MAKFSKKAILAFAFAIISILANQAFAKTAAAANGASVNGTATNGAAANGTAANGPASSSKPVEAIRLFMRSDFYGDLNVLVSDLGARFNSARTGMQLVALPPDGRMFVFNDEAKKIYRVDMSRFSLPGLYRNQYETSKTKGLFFATGKKAKIGGLNAVEFANYRKADLPSLKEMRIKALRSGHPEAVVIPSEIWATTDFTIPKSFLFIVSKISQISEKELFQLFSPSQRKLKKAPIPLRILRITDDGRKLLAVDTNKATRTTATARDFELPKGYKAVSNELQLFMGDESLDFDSLDSAAPAKGKLPFGP